MKILKKISIALAALLVAAVPFSIIGIKANKAEAASDLLLGNATGYTQASDVKYNTSGTYLANWGAREEDCIFLSTDAQNFYTGSYTYDTLSKQSGGSSQSNAHNSVLYSSLKTLMSSKQTKRTSYDSTREMYRYTDCVNGNSNKISSFYSAKGIGPAWDSGATWNREHAWPKSKSLNGDGKGGDDEADIMMLRPTWVQENSSRGNTAYGQSSGYYDPNSEGNGKVNLRGDCARIFLHTYVRWGNTSYAWGQSGVMESMNVLLQWMEEDPVDTWEMGRNDVVEDITGTRNVFVDYPEFAWQLFGQEAPNDMPTPSGKASNGQAGGNGGSSGGNSSTPDGSTDTDTGSGDIDTPDLTTTEGILNALYALSDGKTINGSFTLTGKITAFDEHNYPTIEVEGFEDMPVFCYELKVSNQIGDIITVKAGEMKNYKGTYEFKNCTLISSESGGGNGGNGGDVAGNVLATFDFGANTSTANDGKEITGSKSYTENGYKLNLTDLVKVFDEAYDVKGNSCIKLGSSKAVGGFSFTVPDDVKQVVIYAAKYKTNASVLKINGETHTLTKSSNDGQYDAIVIDTSSVKTIEVETTSNAQRAMINTIEFLGADNSGDSSSDSSSGGTNEDSSSDSSSGGTGGDIDACEHRFGGWTVVVEPTETTDGLQQRTCRLCDEVEEETIPALGDTSSDTGSSGDGSDEPNVCEHNFTDWVTRKEPTETTEGKAIRTCLICGDKEEKILPATGNQSSDSVADSDSDSSNVDSNSQSSDTTSGGDASSDTANDDEVNSNNGETSNSDTAPIGEVGCSGCGSSITIGTSIISFAVLVGCGLVFKKRKEE